jgi:hypothetical protein
MHLGGFYALGFHVEFGDLSSSLEETLPGVFGSVELIGQSVALGLTVDLLLDEG